MPGALEGIRIVDLTNIILGPYGTMLLADQGADVIKVEAPEGDAVRHIGKPGKTPGMGPTYLYVNRNKRSLCLDLKNKDARAALLKVVATADAFVHALRPQAIEALGLGYELAARIGAAAELRAGFHPHGTWGVVGAALAVARLSGADAPAIARTVNVASALSLATSMRTALEGGTVRNAYAGVANQLGLMAWEMAAAGFEGERDGVATVFGRISGTAFRPEAMTEALGTRWEVARNYFKRHACCRYNHAALDALEDIAARHGPVDAAQVASVSIETYGAAAGLDGARPRNALAARFSLPWAAAAFLVRGVADVPAFRADMLDDQRIAALAARVALSEDKAMTARLPAERPARVRVTLADGRVLEAERRSNRGDADDPYPRAAIEEKFLSLATPAWGAARAAGLLRATQEVDASDGFAALARLLPAA